MHALSWLWIVAAAGTVLFAVLWTILEDNGSDLEIIPGILAWVCVVLLVISGIGSLIMWTDGKACRTYAAETEVEYRYGFSAGCRLELEDGRFVPLDSWRLTEERED